MTIGADDGTGQIVAELKNLALRRIQATAEARESATELVEQMGVIVSAIRDLTAEVVVLGEILAAWEMRPQRDAPAR